MESPGLHKCSFLEVLWFLPPHWGVSKCDWVRSDFVHTHACMSHGSLFINACVPTCPCVSFEANPQAGLCFVFFVWHSDILVPVALQNSVSSQRWSLQEQRQSTAYLCQWPETMTAGEERRERGLESVLEKEFAWESACMRSCFCIRGRVFHGRCICSLNWVHARVC